MDWVKAALRDFLLHLAARVSAPAPTDTPPPASRLSQATGQSSDQHAGGGGPLSPRAIEAREANAAIAADDPSLNDFSGFRIILERRLPDGRWQFVSMEMLSERARRQLLAFAQISPAERQAVVDNLGVSPPPEPTMRAVLH